MEFKTTCLTRGKRAGGRAGFTLVELLMALGVGGIVMGVVLAMLVYGGYSFAGMANYADLNTRSLTTLDRMTTEIRQANSLVEFSPTRMAFDMGTGNPQIVYDYSPDSRTLERIEGGRKQVLLTECDSLRFAIFQRTPLPGTYDQHPTATLSTVKSVVVSWVCSRKILGTRFNTESVHTAKIIIRKQ